MINEYFGDTSRFASCWKDGSIQILSDPSVDSTDVTSIYATEEGDFYIAGNVGSSPIGGGALEWSAVLWKNGSPQKLANRGTASSVFVR
jgi:hypothetical protein